jgi:eukaryotic-like serine/threonine-protein kinase
MTPERWQQIENLYHAALEQDTNERVAYVTTACNGDDSLRRVVESLLWCDERAEHFIEAPALEIAARLDAGEQTQLNQSGRLISTLSHIQQDTFPFESMLSPLSSPFIDDYRVIHKIGEGGMGVIYEAEQQHPRRRVALKVIRGGQLVDEYQVKLFQREVQALARLKHPGIAAIYESGRTEDGQHYFAMELVRGTTLLDCFSPDGMRLASGSDDGTAKLWDVTTGQELLTLKGYSNTVLSVAFSPDGQRLATGNDDGTATLWCCPKD